jgi:hypothetical protein
MRGISGNEEQAGLTREHLLVTPSSRQPDENGVWIVCSTPSFSPDSGASWGDFSPTADTLGGDGSLLLECHSNASGRDEALAVYTDHITVLLDGTPPPTSLPRELISGWSLNTEGASVLVDVRGGSTARAVLPVGYSDPIRSAMTRLLGPAD